MFTPPIVLDDRADRVVGNIPSGSTPIVIRDCLELENVKVGDVIAPLDDYIMLWDEVCSYAVVQVLMMRIACHHLGWNRKSCLDPIDRC
jgi:hypothetical protein